MAHFAELDENNIVRRVIVVANEDAPTEEAGAAFCHALVGGRWIQTSYNANIRGKFAGPGDRYDEAIDEFVSVPSDLNPDPDNG